MADDEEVTSGPASSGLFFDTISELSELPVTPPAGLGLAFERNESLFDLDELDQYVELDFGAEPTGPGVPEKVKERWQAFLRKQRHPRVVKLRHKLTFVLGVLDMWLSAYWLGHSPSTFHKLYTLKALLLFSHRWVDYRIKRWHYYLFDFCYFANVLLLIHIWIYPRSVFLHKVTYAFNLGPLAWSIIAFRNSLVYHSVDKLASLFLHWTPACVSWAQRWHPSEELFSNEANPQAARDAWASAGIWDLGLWPILPYAVWAFTYYIKVFIVSSQKIRDKGYETLFSYMMRAKRKTGLALVMGALPHKVQPLAYMALHVALTQLTLLLALVWWRSYAASCAFLLAVLGVSAWNGASYYFEYFANKYTAALVAMGEEVQDGMAPAGLNGRKQR